MCISKESYVCIYVLHWLLSIGCFRFHVFCIQVFWQSIALQVLSKLSFPCIFCSPWESVEWWEVLPRVISPKSILEKADFCWIFCHQIIYKGIGRLIRRLESILDNVTFTLLKFPMRQLFCNSLEFDAKISINGQKVPSLNKNRAERRCHWNSSISQNLKYRPSVL